MKKKDLTHSQLIDAAFLLFAEHGIDKTSLAMIAKEVGISKPSIYYHFSSKEELIERIFDFVFSDYRFEHDFDLAEFNADNFREKLLAGGWAMLAVDKENQRVVLKVLNEFILSALRDEKYRERLIAMQQNYLDGFHRLLVKGAEWGVVPPVNLEAKAHMLALVFDNITSYLLLGLELKYQAIWQTAVDSIFIKEAN
ncbi:TetR family transcriptional regulator [Paenibacillus albidus]|uniref:TetR family transcriptional regulator n=1 Tax=Paenibacillus albidus TaxID=2041023 RepID=A0A917D080_9BACL|nr:TetR/AcrR family transcriptional regulator [Paenibacillus albidus]GGG02628.1 TetR family transcriptional regulator [Paenibacillus albidus]